MKSKIKFMFRYDNENAFKLFSSTLLGENNDLVTNLISLKKYINQLMKEKEKTGLSNIPTISK